MRLIDAEALRMYAGLAVNDDATAYALGHIIDAAPTISCARCKHQRDVVGAQCLDCFGAAHFEAAE